MPLLHNWELSVFPSRRCILSFKVFILFKFFENIQFTVSFFCSYRYRVGLSDITELFLEPNEGIRNNENR
jgi:hypothetical protein